MDWTVELNRRAAKRIPALPALIQERLMYLLENIRQLGPARTEMANYSKLRGTGRKEIHHCHLNRGRPRYVAVWEVLDKSVRLVEVSYVGTHENAPY